MPLYNMEVTSFGMTAELGFKTARLVTEFTVGVRPGDDGLTVTTPNIAKFSEPRKVTVTVWGVPAAKEHDAQRGQTLRPLWRTPRSSVADNSTGRSRRTSPVKPFLSNPTSCGGFTASMKAESWEEPQPEGWFTPPCKKTGRWRRSAASVRSGNVNVCRSNRRSKRSPRRRQTESPSGLEVGVVVPQAWENPNSISTANLDDAKVTLPEGFTINPSAGSGLAGCDPAQYGAETAQSLPGEGCPAESKIGSISIETPLLSEPIPGAIYIAKPYDNPFSEPGHPNGSLLALYVVAKDPEKGIIVKVAGKIEANPVTGRLVTTFNEAPQQPFTRFILKFRPGATAPLVSPPVCGSYALQGELTPWSAPLDVRTISSDPFQITEGVHGGPCPSGGTPPFAPHAVAGTENNAAGSSSPFYLRLERQDGEQELTGFSTIMPPGLTGDLTGIPFCPDAAIEAARGPYRPGRARGPVVSGGLEDRPYDRRSGRRERARADPGEPVSGRPVSWRAVLAGVDHLGDVSDRLTSGRS